MHYLFLRHVVSHFQVHSNQNSELGTHIFELRKWPLVVLVCVVSPSYLHSKTTSSPRKHVWTGCHWIFQQGMFHHWLKRKDSPSTRSSAESVPLCFKTGC